SCEQQARSVRASWSDDPGGSSPCTKGALRWRRLPACKRAACVLPGSASLIPPPEVCDRQGVFSVWRSPSPHVFHLKPPRTMVDTCSQPAYIQAICDDLSRVWGDTLQRSLSMDEALQLAIEMSEQNWMNFQNDLKDLTSDEIQWRPLPQAN